MERLENLLRYLLEELVDKKDQIKITYEVIDAKVTFYVNVEKGEVGRVIGKNGLTANSIRTLMQAAALKDKLFVSVDFLD